MVENDVSRGTKCVPITRYRHGWRTLISYCQAADCNGRRNCRKCTNIYRQATRPKHSELSEEARRRANCRSYANVYQRRGRLIPQPCEVCGTLDDIQKRHDDYSQPLKVRWLCRRHHREGR